MAARKKPENSSQREVTQKDLEAAHRIAKKMTAAYKNRGFQHQADDYANRALNALNEELSRGPVENHEAYLTRSIRNRIFDSLRSQESEIARFDMWANGIDGNQARRRDEYDPYQGRYVRSMVSLQMITREEQEMINLVALAMEQIMPDPDDRAILFDQFSGKFNSITELARAHKRAPNSIANYLKKLLGTDDQPGVVAPVPFILHQISLATAIEFVRIITRLDAMESISNPIEGAIAHCELAATRSRAHQQQAVLGIGHLRWLQNHMPSNRGLHNKVLLRLIRAACIYVMEPNDARHDMLSEVGLHDDVAVVKAVQKAVAKFSK